MLKIGEFSILTGISTHMLRNYDKIGLLKPEKIDHINNYRLYGENQIVRAGDIQVLKRLGFGLSEIIKVLADDRFHNIEFILQSKIKEKEDELHKINMQINEIQHTLNDIHKAHTYTLSVNVKKLPVRKTVSVRYVLSDFTQEGILWQQLDTACKKNKIKLSDVQYCMAMTHNVDYEKHLIDTEVFRIIDQEEIISDELIFTVMQEIEVATVAFQGTYNQIGDVNKCIYEWVLNNSYKISGKPFNIYYLNPGNEQNPNNYITEICFPIKKNS